MRQALSTLAICVLMLAFVVGCGSTAGNPTQPDPSDQAQEPGDPLVPVSGDTGLPTGEAPGPAGDAQPPELTESNQHPLQGRPLQCSHALWGLYRFSFNPEANSCEIVPLRAANLHLNALKFLEPGGKYGMVQLGSGLEWNADKTILDVDIRLVHPFVGLDKFSGFDVKGIVITKGTKGGFSDPDLVLADTHESRLLNADGFTRWWNPREFPGNSIFSYVDGALGFKDEKVHFESTLNGFKYFCDGLTPNQPVEDLDQDDRGVFRAGHANIRHYKIGLEGGFVFNYAIDASWAPALVIPPDVPDDFPPEANQPEPWRITVSEVQNALYYKTETEQGGWLVVDLGVYDWQSPLPTSALGTVVRVVGEWPGLFPPIEAQYVSDEGDHAVWRLTIQPASGALTSTDDVEYLVWAESVDGSGYGGILDPDEPLISANRYLAAVAAEKPNLPPFITDGVTGNSSPGLFTEDYSVEATDPDDDPLTYMWSVETLGEPYNFDDPGNGDGALSVNWADLGFGDYTIQCQVSDSINVPVEATALDVSVGNTPPELGDIEGLIDVAAENTDVEYSISVYDPDVGQSFDFTWSFVPDGDPESFTIPGDPPDGSITIDYSAVPPGLYDLNVRVSDGFAAVTGTHIDIVHNNTPPTVGDVTGKTEVSAVDTDELYQAAWSDPDTTQTLLFLWSVVPEGDPEDFILPSNPDGSINIDWSTYSDGDYDLNVQADDGFAQVPGTKLTVHKIDNMPPDVGAVTGPTSVYHTDLDSQYTAPISDPDGDDLDVFWSIVPHGDPPDYSIPGDEATPLSVDWSTYPDLGEYDVNVQASDTFHSPVEGVALVVTIMNTAPTVGEVTGPTPVDGHDSAAHYSAPFSDPDTAQTLTVLWSVLLVGNPPDYILPANPDGSLDIDWSTLALGDYEINLQVDDGIVQVQGTSLIVSRVNTAPDVGAVTGPTPVTSYDTAAIYSAPHSDLDPGQTLDIVWSLVKHGDPPLYVNPANVDGTFTVDWSGWPIGEFDINIRVDDGFVQVEGTLLTVTKENTPPTVGAVTGPTPVTDVDVEIYSLVPPTTDPDLFQTIEHWYSIVTTGSPPDYSLFSADGEITVDWYTYGVGEWTIGCRVTDGIDEAYATPLDVVVTLKPCEGTAHTYLGTLDPNPYSVLSLSVLPRADIAFLESGVSGMEGSGLAQTGPSTIGMFNADAAGATGVWLNYFLGKYDAVMSLDSDPIDGRILTATVGDPHLLKIIDSSIIMGPCIVGALDSGDPLITWVAVDIEEDGDIWAVQRDGTSGVVYNLVRYTYLDDDPYYEFDPTGTLDITPQVDTNTDIFDIAINWEADMLYLLEAGPLSQGTMHTYKVADGFPAAFMGTLGNVLFSQPLDYDEGAWTGWAGYGDIDIDHVDAPEERCRLLLYGRLEDLTGELIRMDATTYLPIDVQNHPAGYPAFAINPDLDPGTRNLIMPDSGSLHYFTTPPDW